ncbi:sperm acrosome membrane-associated protein 6 isoform X2 [Sebastes umbrosus]|uniref:sperm acrosome membrane-associated protein 6 isoform X2 n=1 Tax=Sebastes umbrosus TaxID=72105 RepID=UPI00189DCABC|nr:sperm acrosome membrane-associated protein 6 isoform X2 [Sebastes umbrosus]
MCTSALCLVCLSLLFGTSLSCYDCFIDHLDSLRLCWGHFATLENTLNLDRCFQRIDRLFNNNDKVFEAARVAEGYENQLGELLRAEIMPIVEEFDKRQIDDTVHEERLTKAAENFIEAASKLPRAFQDIGGVYNCFTCTYDSCRFPLDCPLQEITALENTRIEMLCEVPFPLPARIEVIWRFAASMKTRLVDQFKEVTAGVDPVYSISLATMNHHGTYQCEMFSGKNSIVRKYFYVTVTHQVLVGHSELQEIFYLSLLPRGRLLPDGGFILQPPPSPLLLTACLTAVLLLLTLSLGALYWSSKSEKRSRFEPADLLEDLEYRQLGRYM